MSSVRRKVALQFVVSNLALVANFALSIILARLLSPEEIGIFSMSAVLIAVAHVFRDFGVTAFIKREKELTPDIIRAANGVLLTTSWTVAAAMYFSAVYWAAFFGEPRVLEVVRVLAVGFIFIPFGAIPSAILVRDLKVTKTSVVTAVSTLVYFAVSIGLALLDFGYMTMAWANLVNIIVSGAAYRIALAQPLPWLPALGGWRRIMHFGTGNLLTALLKAADTSLPDVLLGRMHSAAHVGLFSRANSTVNMVGTALNPTINYFATPYLARLHHTNGSIGQEFIKASSLINSVLLPALAVIGVLANDIVLLLYGRAWLASVPAIPWLCLAYAFSSLFTLAVPATIAIGKPYVGIGPLAAGVIAKFIVAISLFDGSLVSFAIAVALGQAISVPAHIYVGHRHLKIPLQEWAVDLGKTTTLSLSVLIVSLAITSQLSSTVHPAMKILLSGIPAAITFLTISRLLKLPIYREIMSLVGFSRD